MDIYKKFFEVCYESKKEMYLNFSSEELKLTAENYYEKVLKPTTINFNDFTGIENKIKMQFPESFKRFFSTCYSIERYFQIPTMTLSVPWEKNPFHHLKEFLFENGLSKKILKKRLIPIGFYQDNFYICLDLRNTNMHVTDVPITMYDLDAGMYGTYDPIAENNAFPTFESFIEHMTNSILTKTFTALNVE